MKFTEHGLIQNFHNVQDNNVFFAKDSNVFRMYHIVHNEACKDSDVDSG